MNIVIALISIVALVLIAIWLANTPPWYAGDAERRRYRKKENLYNKIGDLGVYLFLLLIAIAVIQKLIK
jgi:hypothetical protein